MCPSAESPEATDLDWKLKPILRAAEFVERHINDPIRVGDMADAAGYSVFHFCRCFNLLTRHSPYDYQMKRKLSVAMKELQSGERSITRVAMDFGFDTPEGFSRAFKKMFGVLPSAVRGDEVIDSRFSLLPLTETYLRYLNSWITIPNQIAFDQIELRGTADHHPSLAELLSTFQYREGVAVVDYQSGWEAKGLRVMIEEQSKHELRLDVEAGVYTVFSLNAPVIAVDSFLEYVFTVFCRRSGGPPSFPDRFIFDVVDGMVSEARILSPRGQR